MLTARRKLVTTAVAALAFAGAGTSAAAAQERATEITVSPTITLDAGDTAPFDAPGVKAIRRGKAIPSGYVLVGRKVTFRQGTQVAYAAARFTCPQGKTLRTMAGTNGVFPQPLGTDYLGRRSFLTMISGSADAGETVTGTAYGVCR